MIKTDWFKEKYGCSNGRTTSTEDLESPQAYNGKRKKGAECARYPEKRSPSVRETELVLELLT